MFRETQRILTKANSSSEKLQAMRMILLLIKEKTDFLERFFIKAKVADKLEVEMLSKSIEIQVIDDRKLVDAEVTNNETSNE